MLPSFLCSVNTLTGANGGSSRLRHLCDVQGDQSCGKHKGCDTGAACREEEELHRCSVRPLLHCKCRLHLSLEQNHTGFYLAPPGAQTLLALLRARAQETRPVQQLLQAPRRSSAMNDEAATCTGLPVPGEGRQTDPGPSVGSGRVRWQVSNPRCFPLQTHALMRVRVCVVCTQLPTSTGHGQGKEPYALHTAHTDPPTPETS